jgi:hypothetical protein
MLNILFHHLFLAHREDQTLLGLLLFRHEVVLLVGYICQVAHLPWFAIMSGSLCPRSFRSEFHRRTDMDRLFRLIPAVQMFENPGMFVFNFGNPVNTPNS